MSDVPQGVNPSILVFQNEVTSALVPTPAPAAMILFTPAAGSNADGGGVTIWGDVIGVLADQADLATALGTKLDDVAAGTDAEIVGANAAGTVLQRLGYTITTLLTAAYARASHTGTQLKNTISDFLHATDHAPGGTDALPWTTIHGRGLAAARPTAAAGNAGYVYYSTDTQALERSTGSAWESIAPTVAPGGSDTQVQFNNAGAFGGDSGFTFNSTNNTVDLGGAALTVASDPILDLSQTWNNAAVAFTGVKLDVTNTASATGSLLQDWRVSGTSRATLNPLGYLSLKPQTASITFPLIMDGQGANGTELGSYFGVLVVRATNGPTISARMGPTDITIPSNGVFGFSSSTTNAVSSGSDTILNRDAAGILAQRNGTNAQTFRAYGTYTDASNYERGFIRFNAGTMEIGNEFAGSGSARSIRIVQSGGSYADGIILQVNNTTNLSFYGYGLFNGSGLYSSQSALTVTTPDAVGFSVNAAHTSVKAGGAWIYAGNNANGGNVYLDGGAGYGTGTDGDVIVGNTKGSLVVRGGLICESQFRLKSYTVATLPSAATAGALIYVTDETGGATVAFSDGTNWRRVADRSVCA